jgi:hypothetical protein
MTNFMRSMTIVMLAFTLSCLGLNGTADAYPSLQLDIGGGVYDPVTETVMATSDPFTLYAFASPSGNLTAGEIVGITGTYYLSVALTPKTSPPGGDFGSFSILGDSVNETVDVTGDMIFGTPPDPAVASSGDLPSHGIFETYFTQYEIVFDGTQTTPYNTQDNPGGNLVAGSGMYDDAFTIDMSLLEEGFGLHFDLYALADDGTIDFKAPFSHDAGGGTPPVPEPATFLLVGSGMAALAMFRRRQNRK